MNTVVVPHMKRIGLLQQAANADEEASKYVGSNPSIRTQPSNPSLTVRRELTFRVQLHMSLITMRALQPAAIS